MIRAFVALPLPTEIAAWCERMQTLLPGGRAVARDNLHLTLAFLGNQPRPVLEDLHLALSALRCPGFVLELRGLQGFGRPHLRSVHALARPVPALDRLQARVETAARHAGIVLPARRFVPHVTLVRFGGGRGERVRLERAIAETADAAAPPFAPGAFALYRSHLSRSGADYEELARYPLIPVTAGRED